MPSNGKSSLLLLLLLLFTLTKYEEKRLLFLTVEILCVERFNKLPQPTVLHPNLGHCIIFTFTQAAYAPLTKKSVGTEDRIIWTLTMILTSMLLILRACRPVQIRLQISSCNVVLVGEDGEGVA